MSLRAKYKQEIATGTACPRNDTMFWPYRLRSEDRSKKAQENLTRGGSQSKNRVATAQDFFADRTLRPKEYFVYFEGAMGRYAEKDELSILTFLIRSVAYKKREQGEIRSRPANTPVLH